MANDYDRFAEAYSAETAAGFRIAVISEPEPATLSKMPAQMVDALGRRRRGSV